MTGYAAWRTEQFILFRQDVRMSNSDFPITNILAGPEPRQPACRLVASSAPAQAEQSRPPEGAVRSMGRPDTLTAQRVEVGIVLHAMLGLSAATDYFAKHGVDDAVAQRVLGQPARRRGQHDASGVRT